MERRFLLTAVAVLHFGVTPVMAASETSGDAASGAPLATSVTEPLPAAPAAPAPEAAPETAAVPVTEPAPAAQTPAAALPDLPAVPGTAPAPEIAAVKPLVETPQPVKPKPAAVRPIKDPTPQTSWPIAQRYYPTEVNVRPEIPVGSIIIVSDKFFLYHIIAPGKAMRYGVAVGKDELKFRGQAVVARKVRWPSWRPTPEMVQRSPQRYAKYAEAGMPGGPSNPLGARALYLYQNGQDTAIRIHGTTEPSSIGHAVSNGCLRMVNDHVIALFNAVPLGTPVTVY